jgi:hypothetical protein
MYQSTQSIGTDDIATFHTWISLVIAIIFGYVSRFRALLCPSCLGCPSQYLLTLVHNLVSIAFHIQRLFPSFGKIPRAILCQILQAAQLLPRAARRPSYLDLAEPPDLWQVMSLSPSQLN